MIKLAASRSSLWCMTFAAFCLLTLQLSLCSFSELTMELNSQWKLSHRFSPLVAQSVDAARHIYGLRLQSFSTHFSHKCTSRTTFNAGERWRKKKAKCIKRDLRDSDSHLNIFSLYDTVAPVESYTKLLNVILNAPKYISLRWKNSEVL